MLLMSGCKDSDHLSQCILIYGLCLIGFMLGLRLVFTKLEMHAGWKLLCKVLHYCINTLNRFTGNI